MSPWIIGIKTLCFVLFFLLLTACPQSELHNPAYDMSTDMHTQSSSNLQCNEESIDRYINQQSIAIRWDRQFVITDPSVVNDACRTQWTGRDANGNPCPADSVGHWTFGYIMKQISGNIPTEQFIEKWIKSWESTQTANNHTIAGRRDISLVINSNWGLLKYIPENAPFRLLAIVNRIDLANLPGPYASAPQGEARFIFGLVDSAGQPMQATFSFEFQYSPLRGKKTLDWANAWYALGNVSASASKEQYNVALQDITDQFIDSYSHLTGPNLGTAFLRLRTNESAFGGDGSREWREYTLQDASGVQCDASAQKNCQLVLQVLNTTPHYTFNETSVLAAWILEHKSEILSQSHLIPATFVNSGTTHWLAGGVGSVAATNRLNIWSYPGATLESDVRHSFSVSTCNGCHYSDTGTNFYHIRPRTDSAESEISDYLKLNDLKSPSAQRISDPISGEYRFTNEPRRRACEMIRILSGSDKRYRLAFDFTK